jgi:CRISPR-associated protein Cas1
MRKLLNTLYITRENAWLLLDGNNIVCRMDDEERFRIPFDNVESIVCFSYLGCSPALMGKCAEKMIPINFLTPQGRFLARVNGNTRGNVVLRVRQIDCFRESGLSLAQNTIGAKLANTITLLRRSMHDNPTLRTDDALTGAIDTLKQGITAAYATNTMDELLGVEGNCARCYFGVFGKLLSSAAAFELRTKRPPLDPVNAALSFVYTLYTNDFAAALETVGLDSYIGFGHALRSGRDSLACDMVEETRCIAERFVLTLFNLKILTSKDFDTQPTGAVWLDDDGRKKLLKHWQEKKRTDLMHPYLKQKIQIGLLPYVQSNLLAKYVRGDISEYPSYVQR